MSSNKMNYDFKKLNAFAKSISQNHAVRVGILGNKSARKTGKVTNAEIGALHEFGSLTKNIPPRSFLRMPLHVKKEQILEQASKGATKLVRDNKIVLVLKRLGVACENAVQEAFATHGFGRWASNTPATIARKGSSSPLIDTSQLRHAISSKVVINAVSQR